MAGSSARLLFGDTTPHDLHDAAVARAVSDVIQIGGAVLAVFVVRRLTAGQESARVGQAVRATSRTV